MPAKQKVSKKKQELSDSAASDSDNEPVTTRSTRSRLSSKNLKDLKKPKPIKKKEKRFITIADELKISPSNALLVSYITGAKNPISRTEMTARAKEFLRNSEFNSLKITVAALNCISLVMNARFGTLFNIAAVLANYRKTKTITALELDLAQVILDHKLSSVNLDQTKITNMIDDYRGVKPWKLDNNLIDKFGASLEKITEDTPTQAQIRSIFKDQDTVKQIEKEMKKYYKAVSQ